MDKRYFHRRAFISTGAFIYLILLFVSGFLIRGADRNLFPVAIKTYWTAVHLFSGLFLVLFAVIHIIINRRTLMHSLKFSGNGIINILLLALVLLASWAVSSKRHSDKENAPANPFIGMWRADIPNAGGSAAAYTFSVVNRDSVDVTGINGGNPIGSVESGHTTHFIRVDRSRKNPE